MTRGTVSVDSFSGSLEDLARAMERREIDPLSVSVCDVIQTYVEKMRSVRKPSLDDRGSLLAAASALILAKSKALLPSEAVAPDGSPPDADPPSDEGRDKDDRNEALIAHLMEYRMFKEAVEQLARREETWRAVFSRDSMPPGAGDPHELRGVDLGDLVSALRGILEDMPGEEFTGLPADDLAIGEKMDSILVRLHHEGKISFRELFANPTSRAEVIAVFLALLELIRLAGAVVRQDSHFGEILIYPGPGGSASGV